MLLRPLVCRIGLLAAIGTLAAHASELSPVTDRQITQQVQRLINQHPEFGLLITVQTRKGIVYLGGSPWTSVTMSNLEFLVRHTDGVADVVVTAIYPEG
jgi:osmotically-inducible protein OsmY